MLTDEIGDWIGGIRFTLRGGVAHVVDIGVVPGERGRGHALRLLEAFEAHAEAAGAHLIEFWTDQMSGRAPARRPGLAPRDDPARLRWRPALASAREASRRDFADLALSPA